MKYFLVVFQIFLFGHLCAQWQLVDLPDSLVVRSVYKLSDDQLVIKTDRTELTYLNGAFEPIFNREISNPEDLLFGFIHSSKDGVDYLRGGCHYCGLAGGMKVFRRNKDGENWEALDLEPIWGMSNSLVFTDRGDRFLTSGEFSSNYLFDWRIGASLDTIYTFDHPIRGVVGGQPNPIIVGQQEPDGWVTLSISEDEAQSFASLPYPGDQNPNNQMRAIFSSPNGQIYIVTELSDMLIYRNGGFEYLGKLPVGITEFMSLQFAEDETLFVVTRTTNGVQRLHISEDRAQTWQQDYSFPGGGFPELRMKDAHNGVMALGGKLYHRTLREEDYYQRILLKLYPNPVGNILRIETETDFNLSGLTYEIYRMDGALVKSGLYRTAILTRFLTPGSYILRLSIQGIPVGEAMKFVRH